MTQIEQILEKMTSLWNRENIDSLLDVDMMMDYTRQLYSELHEYRKIYLYRNNEEESDALPMPKEHEQDAALPTFTASISPAPPTMHRGDIRTRIGINDKYIFTNELFHGDNDVYEDVIKKINTFPNYDEALNWINWFIHDQHKWDDENNTVKMFYEMLNSFFSENGITGK